MGRFNFRKDRWNSFSSNLLNALLGILLLLALWYLVAEIVIAWKGVAFPAPLDTFTRLIELLGGESLYNESIYTHVGTSLMRWAAGYALAVTVGILIGISLGIARKGHDIGIIPVYILQMIPGLAWVPIAVLLFGLGNVSTGFMIFMTALPPIALSTSSGIRGVQPNMVRAAEMTGASRPRIFFRVLLPASAMSVINGLRIGLANGWRVLIAVEMVVGVAIGLGYSIFQSRWSLDFEAAFVCIVIICVMGLVIEKLIFVVLEDKVRERMGLTEDSLVLEIRNLSKIFYDSKRGNGVVALRNIDLEVRRNEFLCIIGPSGCGKSTLINLIAGFERPSRGEILHDGLEVNGPSPSRGVVFQDHSLFPWMTVQENIEFGLGSNGLPLLERRSRVIEYLDLIGLADFKDAKPSELSGGMRQKVAVARTLALEPDVLLLPAQGTPSRQCQVDDGGLQATRLL